MNESELIANWSALEPTPDQRRRMDARVRGWLDAAECSLLSEWLNLIKANPLAGVALAAVSSVLVLFTTPIGWVALAIL